MEKPGVAETKKAVCRSFANVVKQSHLSSALDPKAFFMMMSTHFPVLYQDGRLDLGPIWTALSPQHSEEELIGLFLRFEDSAQQLGIPVQQSTKVAALATEQRQAHLLKFQEAELSAALLDPSGLTPLLELSTDPNAPAPSAIQMAEVQPLFDDELRKKVSQAVVQAIRQAPVGQLIEGGQVAYLIDSSFGNLCDGQQFDFRPVYAALRALPKVDDASIYPAIARLEDTLRPLRLIAPDVALTAEEKKLAVQASEARIAVARQASIAPSSSRPDLTKPAPDKTDKTDKMPRPVITGPAQTRRRSRIIASGVTFAMCLSIAGYVTYLRMDRALDANDFNAVFPIKQASQVNGTFQGQIDDAKWRVMSLDARKKAIADLAQQMKSEGMLIDMQIRDGSGHMVITNRGPEMVVSPYLLNLNLPTEEAKPPVTKK